MTCLGSRSATRGMTPFHALLPTRHESHPRLGSSPCSRLQIAVPSPRRAHRSWKLIRRDGCEPASAISRRAPRAVLDGNVASVRTLALPVALLACAMAACSRQAADARTTAPVQGALQSGPPPLPESQGAHTPTTEGDVAIDREDAQSPRAPDAQASSDLGPCRVVGKLSSRRHNMATIAIPDGRVLFIGGGLYDESGDQVEVERL